ncbi:hypothetical protein OCK74_17390 [Chitinophagaceae bacterium LB-8]|uniref:Uncharacterized protein n=1 Tax=Paraflavisolibacter caeni TaxID=2982496 RepID=A0A9X3BJ99_9BACT|nr:hypothetical protein [Paraflavisolibacter caeni]MCU7550898.1 hypothetical protein [Paraflavisolibacter caeni]
MYLFQRIYQSRHFVLIPIISTLFIQCQSNSISCKDIKNGKFQFYSKRSGERYLVIRQDTLQKELNINTGDTSYWKVKWLSDCTFSATYLSGGPEKTEEEKDFLTRHQTVVQILKITPTYYIVEGSLDSINSDMSIVDTIWIKGK